MGIEPTYGCFADSYLSTWLTDQNSLTIDECCYSMMGGAKYIALCSLSLNSRQRPTRPSSFSQIKLFRFTIPVRKIQPDWVFAPTTNFTTSLQLIGIHPLSDGIHALLIVLTNGPQMPGLTYRVGVITLPVAPMVPTIRLLVFQRHKRQYLKFGGDDESRTRASSHDRGMFYQLSYVTICRPYVGER